MEALYLIGMIISWAGIIYLYIQQRNMVSSARQGDRVILMDKKGIIKKNIIAE